MIWIFIGSLVCSLIYSITTYEYMYNEAMWDECIFPGIFVWNRLKEKNLSIVTRVIIAGIAWITLFAYSLILIMFCVFVLIVIGIDEFIKHIRKGG